MLFFKLITLLLTFVTLSFAQDNLLNPRGLSNLVARNVPVCPQQSDYTTPPSPAFAERRERELSANRNATKGRLWRPNLCDLKFWVCVYLLPGVNYTSAGVPGSGVVAETFVLEAGIILQAIWYWTGTLQYTAVGGSVNIYPAHGTNYICVKGVMAVQVLGYHNFIYEGNSTNPDELVCQCHWKRKGPPKLSSDNNLMIWPVSPNKRSKSI